MGYQLGIDLGTTYTAAAVCRSSDRRWVEPEVVTLGTRGTTIPSVLFVAPDGSVLIGDAAERRALTEPDRVVREFKRRIGDPTPIVIGGRRWAPEELSARLVRWVVDRVAEREGGPATRIAITHPASWGSHKKDLLAGALGAVGLTVTFLAEPQAAALHYAAAERIDPGATIAVYDLGGGTFDAAVVRKADPGEAAAAGAAGFGLLGHPEGLERLGGIDFDDVVFEHVREGLPGAFENLDDSDPAVLSAVAHIRRECTEAKEALSSDTETSIPVMLPASRGAVRLHRTEFETLIGPQLAETVEALRKAVASAGLEPSQLTAVLLVGGSSRIPLVAQMVSEQFGRPVAVDADPKNAIAKGAALAISPKPTASWPGVAIAPVPGASPAGPGVKSPQHGPGPGPNAAPPARPPRPALNTPPRGSDKQAQQPQGPSRLPAPAALVGQQARGPVGPSHEPARSLLSSNTPSGDLGRRPVPPEPPTRHVMTPGWEYDPEPEPRRRPVGVLIGIGGLLAVAAVVIVVLVMNTSAPTGALSPAGNSTDYTAPATDSAATNNPGPVNNPPANTGSTGNTGNTGNAGNAGNAGKQSGKPAPPVNPPANPAQGNPTTAVNPPPAPPATTANPGTGGQNGGGATTPTTGNNGGGSTSPTTHAGAEGGTTAPTTVKPVSHVPPTPSAPATPVKT